VRYIFERGLVENHLCGCGQPFRSCPYWRDVFDRAFGGFEALDANRLLELSSQVDRVRYIPLLAAPALRSSTFRRRLTDWSATLGRLYGAMAEVARADVLVDSSKDPSYAFL